MKLHGEISEQESIQMFENGIYLNAIKNLVDDEEEDTEVTLKAIKALLKDKERGSA